MLWRYLAVDAASQEVSGIESGARAEVCDRLKGRSLVLVSLEADLVRSFDHFLGKGAVPLAGLSFFFRDFANMLHAGLAVNHILMTFRESARDMHLRMVCGQIADDLSSGMSLGQAMERQTCFPRLAGNVVAAGERAGHIPMAMELLADHFTLAAELKGRCSRALLYPAGILVFLLAALVYISRNVVPSLMPLLPSEAWGSPLTRGMLMLSRSVGEHWFCSLIGIALLGMTGMVLIRRRKKAWDRIILRLPGIGVVRRDLEISMCFFDLFVRLKSGIPLDTAMREAATAADNATGDHLEQSRQFLAAGHSFSGALARTGFFPSLVIGTIRLGEEMGSYDAYCQRVFKLYYRSFEDRLEVLSGAVQPMAMALCAAFVAAMAFAFLQPIYANLARIGTLKP